MTRRALRRTVDRLAALEAELSASFRAGDQFAEHLAGFARRQREKAEAELEPRRTDRATLDLFDQPTEE